MGPSGPLRTLEKTAVADSHEYKSSKVRPVYDCIESIGHCLYDNVHGGFGMDVKPDTLVVSTRNTDILILLQLTTTSLECCSPSAM